MADSGSNDPVLDAVICDFSTKAYLDTGRFAAGVKQSGLQIGAMTNDIGMVPALASLVAERHFHQRAGFASIHEIERFRRYGLGRKTVSNGEPFQMAHCIGGKLQASADFRKGFCLFDKPDIPAACCQFQRCRQTGNSGPGNQYTPFAHVCEVFRPSAPREAAPIKRRRLSGFVSRRFVNAASRNGFVGMELGVVAIEG